MTKSDYDKYYKKGGTYVIPVEVFNELFDELERQISNYEQLIDVLDSITWYNGIYEPLLDLKKDLLNCDNKGNYTKCNDNLEYKHELFHSNQFEIFWMMLVLMFGDYGTSPRSGWLYLDKKEEIIEFIDKITKTSQEDLDKVD